MVCYLADNIKVLKVLNSKISATTLLL